ncbi:response regulator transcription factor [Murdochiella massiliensis]|uniref:response regulator transcription factor n=1 Tax=Murdochiella massiliensis TaxID=1673723 RepID=UPI00082CCE2C|nr:response regulator transcription factor [Murdochiella massiliensis]
MKQVYIVEDDQNIRELISYALNNNGYKARGFEDAKALYAALDSDGAPILFLLDIMLEGEDGYSILSTIRNRVDTKEIPVIMVTAKTSEFEKVRGLDMGADDYVTKPFGVLELLSRVKAVLRRYGDSEERSLLVHNEIAMDPKKRETIVGGKPVQLTYKEFELLYYLMNNLDVVLSRDRIMNAIWGYDYAGETRTVDVHIRALRQKLGDAGRYIKTVRNVGYKLSKEA